MSSQKTFVLGVGAQKGGTTWVQKYLDTSPSSDFGVMKEYHIRDALYLKELAEFDLRPKKFPLRQRLRGLRARVQSKPPLPLLLRQSLQRNPERYFTYFGSILARPGISLTCDITPSYAGLSVDVLEK